MEQAASVVSHGRYVPPTSACVRLRQGSSTRATWVLEDAPGGTTITVGADATCDWQVRAAFVPARAFALAFIDGEVFVQAGPDQGVLLNGKLLASGWVPVPNGARIDVGLARVEVTTDPTGSFASAARTAFASTTPEPPSHVSSIFDALPVDDAAPSSASSSHVRGSVSGAFALPTPSLYDSSPALLECDSATDKGALRRYALVGVATACAYGGWLALLDYL